MATRPSSEAAEAAKRLQLELATLQVRRPENCSVGSLSSGLARGPWYARCELCRAAEGGKSVSRAIGERGPQPRPRQVRVSLIIYFHSSDVARALNPARDGPVTWHPRGQRRRAGGPAAP